MDDLEAIFDAEAVRKIFDGGQNMISVFKAGLSNGSYKIFSSEKSKIFEDDDVKVEIQSIPDIVLKNSKNIKDHSRLQAKTMEISKFPMDKADMDIVSAGAVHGATVVSGQQISFSLSKSELGAEMGVKVSSVEEFFS